MDLIGKPRKKFMLLKMLGLAAKAGLELKLLVSLDDSLGKISTSSIYQKGKATKRLEERRGTGSQVEGTGDYLGQWSVSSSQ